MTTNESTDCAKQTYRCPECGNETTVSPKTDSILVLIGCSDGHDPKDMAERERLVDMDGDQ